MAVGTYCGDADVAPAPGFDFVVAPVDALNTFLSRIIGQVDMLDIDTAEKFTSRLVEAADRYRGRLRHLVFTPPECVFDDRQVLRAQLLDLPASCSYIVNIPVLDDEFYWQFWNYVLHGSVSCALYFAEGIEVLWPTLRRYSTLPVAYIDARGAPSEYIRAFAMPRPPSLVVLNSAARLELATLLSCPSYVDKIIKPLQPLHDNLTNDIYSRFETDSEKYSRYLKAIRLAVTALHPRYVLVAGPGRGPLVQSVVEHSSASITAVEKNPHCIALLQHKNAHDWQNRVNIVHDDVRNHHKNYDLVVSEMLGSFGCNELCPEILQDFECSMIPEAYTSYLRPIYSPMVPKDHPAPFLAEFSVFYPLSEHKPCWRYSHPIKQTQQSAAIEFVPQYDEYVNALEGTFSASLYQDVTFSNIKGSSDYVSSWFPMIFPVSETRLEKGKKYTVSMERKVTQLHVWYEWEFLGTRYNTDGVDDKIQRDIEDEN